MKKFKLLTIIEVSFVVCAIAFGIAAFVLFMTNWSGYTWIPITLASLAFIFIAATIIMIILSNIHSDKITDGKNKTEKK